MSRSEGLGSSAQTHIKTIDTQCSTRVLHYSITPCFESDMSTTTIRLPDELKARVAAAAKHAGTTAHGFILEAIAEKTEQAERRADFDSLAEARYARIVATGKTIPWPEMRSYLEAHMRGEVAQRPVARKLAR